MQPAEHEKIDKDLMNIAKILIGGMIAAFVLAIVLLTN